MEYPTRYFAIFVNGEYLRCKSLDEAKNVPFKKWIINSDRKYEHTTGHGSIYQYFDYNIINDNDERDYIKVDNCACLEIGTEIRYWGSECKLFPKIVDPQGNFRKLKYETRNAEGIDVIKFIVNDLNEISKVGSFEKWIEIADNKSKVDV